MKIFYFLIEVAPAPNSSNFNDAGGAFVNCWIKSSSKKSAEMTAQAAIQNDGWDIIAVDETFVAARVKRVVT